MQVYFSHSYRDATINGPFLDHFVVEDIPLEADQKTDVWCVPKLERYLGETTGFVSIIPLRATDQDAGGYSPYIGQELALARRARVPRLLFVDARVLNQHPIDFPEDAVAFDPENLGAQAGLHRGAIRQFGVRLEAAQRPPRDITRGHVPVVVGRSTAVREASADVAEILGRRGFHPRRVDASRVLDDILLLESLYRAELCVFVLDARVSEVHVALAMAHAQGIPSVRLQHDSHVKQCEPSLSGVIGWPTREQMVIELARQLKSFREGTVSPVELARTSGGEDAARSIGTMQWSPHADNDWAVADGPALVDHVHPEHLFVRDEVTRTRRAIARALGRVHGREGCAEVSEHLYDGLKRHHFAYEFEDVSTVRAHQAIRAPRQISTHQTATCLDVVCLFASLLEAAHQQPLVVIVEGESFAHALAGYRVRGEPPIDGRSLGDVRGAMARGDIVLFEATGAIEADAPVGAETTGERSEKLLGYADAVAAARRMLMGDVTLKHFVDIAVDRAARAT